MPLNLLVPNAEQQNFPESYSVPDETSYQVLQRN